MAVTRQGIAHQEIAQCDQTKHLEGLISHIVQHGAGLGQLDEADDRRQGGALDHLNRETDGRRNGDTHRLRRDDAHQRLRETQTETTGCLPLTFRQGGDAAGPDIHQKSAGE